MRTEIPAEAKGLSFTMKQKLWSLASVLVLLRTGLNFSIVGQREMTHWKPRGAAAISPQINHATPQSPKCGSSECFPCYPVEEPYSHWQQNHCKWQEIKIYIGITQFNIYLNFFTKVTRWGPEEGTTCILLHTTIELKCPSVENLYRTHTEFMTE